MKTVKLYNNIASYGANTKLPSSYVASYMHAKQKQPGCKISARPIRSHNGYKRPKTLISSKAKKLNILLRILLLE